MPIRTMSKSSMSEGEKFILRRYAALCWQRSRTKPGTAIRTGLTGKCVMMKSLMPCLLISDKSKSLVDKIAIHYDFKTSAV